LDGYRCLKGVEKAFVYTAEAITEVSAQVCTLQSLPSIIILIYIFSNPHQQKLGSLDSANQELMSRPKGGEGAYK